MPKSNAAQLEQMLKARNLSQGALARSMGVEPATVSRWLSGQRAPDLRFAIWLQKEFGLDPLGWKTLPARTRAAS